MSKVYSLQAIQKIPINLETAWDFFSKPENLNAITPKKLDFRILNISKAYTNEMYAGQVIEYYIRPLLGITLYWMTEITHVKHKQYFIDEQRFGPYALWHHQHHFKEIEGGVEMTDMVHYKIPYWFIGDVANAIIVQKQLKEIFEYRFKMIEEKYGKWPVQNCHVQFK